MGEVAAEARQQLAQLVLERRRLEEQDAQGQGGEGRLQRAQRRKGPGVQEGLAMTARVGHAPMWASCPCRHITRVLKELFSSYARSEAREGVIFCLGCLGLHYAKPKVDTARCSVYIIGASFNSTPQPSHAAGAEVISEASH